jgi:hypothetical protein
MPARTELEVKHFIQVSAGPRLLPLAFDTIVQLRGPIHSQVTGYVRPACNLDVSPKRGLIKTTEAKFHLSKWQKSSSDPQLDVSPSCIGPPAAPAASVGAHAILPPCDLEAQLANLSPDFRLPSYPIAPMQLPPWYRLHPSRQIAPAQIMSE